MRNRVSVILFVVLILCCSCVLTRNNVDIFPNSEIPDEVVLAVYNGNLGKISDSYRIFDNYRTYMPAEKIFGMQALGDNVALARVAYQHSEYGNGFTDRYDNLVLLIGEVGSFFYDDMVINVGINEEVKQIGVFTYTTVNETQRTVPIVTLVK